MNNCDYLYCFKYGEVAATINGERYYLVKLGISGDSEKQGGAFGRLMARMKDHVYDARHALSVQLDIPWQMNGSVESPSTEAGSTRNNSIILTQLEEIVSAMHNAREDKRDIFPDLGYIFQVPVGQSRTYEGLMSWKFSNPFDAAFLKDTNSPLAQLAITEIGLMSKKTFESVRETFSVMPSFGAFNNLFGCDSRKELKDETADALLSWNDTEGCHRELVVKYFPPLWHYRAITNVQ